MIRNGGARRDRTADLLNANQALSHLSYGPIRCMQANRCFRSFIESPITSRIDVSELRPILDKCARILLVVRSPRRRIVCYASCGDRATSEILVGLGGFEPPTSPLSGVRSNQLSYRPFSTCAFCPARRYACSSLSHVH